MNFLIVDGYAPDARAKLGAAGCTLAGDLYARMVEDYAPGARYEIVHPADGPEFLARPLADFDSLLWTGSSLNIYDDIPGVRRQVELARAAFSAGVPSFGSCWALHVAVTAAGGRCRLNPNGREFGISRRIELNDAGRAHPMFADKPPVFDGFTSHFDDVEVLPRGSTALASNGATNIQAAEITANDTSFWAVQYHPEYDLREIAALARFRAEGLIAEGRFRDEDDLRGYYGRYESLHDRFDEATARELEIGADLSDGTVRCAEFRAWVKWLVGGRGAIQSFRAIPE